MVTQKEALAQPTAPRPWAGRVSGAANAVPFQEAAWSAPCTMVLQNVVLTHDSEGTPEEPIPVGAAGDQTEAARRKAPPWSSSARQRVVEGQPTAPSVEAWATAAGDDHPVAEAMVVVVGWPVVRVGSAVVRAGLAADVHPATRRASATTVTGERLRIPRPGGRCDRRDAVGPAGINGGEGRPGPSRAAGPDNS